MPIIDYGDIVYLSLLRDSRERQKLQNWALCIIEEADHLATVELHQQVELPYLSDRRHMHMCNEVYKGINNIAPKIMCDKLLLVQDYHTRGTRSANNQSLVVPELRFDLSRKDIRIGAVSIGIC